MRLFLLLLTYAFSVTASELPATDAIKHIEGVYKHRFKNGIITPGKAPMVADTPYQSEDIVEITRYDERRIYVRASLQFYNGHSCGVYGMARYENGAFIYRALEKPYRDAPTCTLKIVRTKDALTLTDRLTPDGVATCKHYCGMRGGLSNYAIPMKARRPIRYTKRIEQSRQYLHAVDELKKADASQP